MSNDGWGGGPEDEIMVDDPDAAAAAINALTENTPTGEEPDNEAAIDFINDLNETQPPGMPLEEPDNEAAIDFINDLNETQPPGMPLEEPDNEAAIDFINDLNETQAPGTSLDIEDNGLDINCISDHYNECTVRDTIPTQENTIAPQAPAMTNDSGYTP